MLDYLREGRVMDGMHEFYADDVVMEEPAYGKTVGLAANLEREQAFVESVAEFKTFEATPAIGEDFSCYENVMEWTTKDGKEIRVEQVAVQHWRDGKIVYERFYYDNV
jgi:ketosteroid isomerase-like protein